jgi:hypothetical protein
MTIPIQKYLNTIVSVEDPAGVDGYGKKTYSASRDAICRFERVTKVIKDAQGRDVTANARAFFLPDDTIDLGSKVTHTGETYTVVQVDEPPFLDQVSHIEVMLSYESR